eukprot:PhM_4_TR6655/c0_g1_i1/m.67268
MTSYGVLSASEWDGLKAILDDSKQRTIAETVAKSADLHTACQQRVRNWPNTIDAIRARKIEAMEKKREAEEARRQVIDREEADLRSVRRGEDITAASLALFRAREEARAVQSKALLRDVVAERDDQVAVMSVRKAQQEQERARWAQRVEEDRQNYEKEQSAKNKKRLEGALRLRLDHVAQLEELKTKRLGEMRALQEEGRRIKEDADRAVEEENARLSARKEKALATSREQLAAATARRGQREYEKGEEQEILAQQERYHKLKEYQMEHRQHKQVVAVRRQVQMREALADTMAAQLVDQPRLDAERAERQAEELKQREADRRAQETARREAEAALIHESRQQQMQRHRAQREREAQFKARMGEATRRNDDALHLEDEMERQRRWEEAHKVDRIRQLQMQLKDRKKAKEREAARLEREALEDDMRQERELLDIYTAQTLS